MWPVGALVTPAAERPCGLRSATRSRLSEVTPVMPAESHECAGLGRAVGGYPPKQGVGARVAGALDARDVECRRLRGKLSAVLTRLDHEVDLWWLVVPGRGSPAPRRLSAEERAVQARGTARHRRPYVVTRALVRAVLAGYLDCAPTSVSLVRGPNGKPRLDGAGGLRFNVSHSGAILVVAVTAGTEIGVDVELVRPVQRDARLARRWFSEADAASLAVSPADLRTRRFMELWTRREAVAKLSGDGLWGSSSRDSQSAAVDSSVFNVDVVPGYATAVAVTGLPRAVRLLSVASFLALAPGGEAHLPLTSDESALLADRLGAAGRSEVT